VCQGLEALVTDFGVRKERASLKERSHFTPWRSRVVATRFRDPPAASGGSTALQGYWNENGVPA